MECKIRHRDLWATKIKEDMDEVEARSVSKGKCCFTKGTDPCDRSLASNNGTLCVYILVNLRLGRLLLPKTQRLCHLHTLAREPSKYNFISTTRSLGIVPRFNILSFFTAKMTTEADLDKEIASLKDRGNFISCSAHSCSSRTHALS